MPWQGLEELRPFGRTDSGELFEQTVLLCYQNRELRLRRVLLQLEVVLKVRLTVNTPQLCLPLCRLS